MELNNKVNNSTNRGVELLLRRRKAPKPNVFHVKFGKMVTFLRREITIKFELGLDIKPPQ